MGRSLAKLSSAEQIRSRFEYFGCLFRPGTNARKWRQLNCQQIRLISRRCLNFGDLITFSAIAPTTFNFSRIICGSRSRKTRHMKTECRFSGPRRPRRSVPLHLSRLLCRRRRLVHGEHVRRNDEAVSRRSDATKRKRAHISHSARESQPKKSISSRRLFPALLSRTRRGTEVIIIVYSFIRSHAFGKLFGRAALGID